MKLSHGFSCLVVISTCLSGCDSSGVSVTEEASRPVDSRPLSSTQVNVFDNSIAAAKHAPLVAPLGSVNLFSNPDFESGLDGWNSCNATSMTLSFDTSQGKQALEIMPDNCAYRSVQVEEGGTYVLSCDVKLTSTKAWTGMGLVFANAGYESLLDGPVAQATSGGYTTLQSKGTAPKGTSFVSMWLHSDHGALVDNCSLTLENDQPVISPDDGNLLDNSDFASLDTQGDLANWASGCNGNVLSLDTAVTLEKGACVDQSLNVVAIETLKNTDATLGCYIAEAKGYSDLSVFLDGNLSATTRIEPTQKTIFVSVDVDATTASNGFVTLYSDDTLTAEVCTFDTVKPTVPSEPGDDVADRAPVDPDDVADPAPVDPGDGNTPVVFGGGRLESAVRSRLNLPDTSTPVTRNDMLDLTFLAAGTRRPTITVESLVGLEYATNLSTLEVGSLSDGLDLEPIKGLTKIRRLWTNATVSDLTPLTNMTELVYVRAPLASDVSNLEPLSRLTALQTIILIDGQSIVDISPMSGLTNLSKLVIDTAPEFSDLTPLTNLTRLELVEFLSSSSISDLSPLSGATGLYRLTVKSRALTDISPVLDLPIGYLDVRDTPVASIQQLVDARVLNTCQFESGRPFCAIYLYANIGATDLSPGSADMQALTTLTDASVRIALYGDSENLDLSPNSPDVVALNALAHNSVSVFIDGTFLRDQWGTCPCVGEDNGQLRPWSAYFGTAYPIGPIINSEATLVIDPVTVPSGSQLPTKTSMLIYQPGMSNVTTGWLGSLIYESVVVDRDSEIMCSVATKDGLEAGGNDPSPFLISTQGGTSEWREDCQAGLKQLYPNTLVR